MNPVWFNFLGVFNKEDQELFRRYARRDRPTTRLLTEERERIATMSRRMATLYTQLFGTSSVSLGPDTRVGPSAGLQLEGDPEEVIKSLDPWVRMRAVLHDA